MAIAKKKAPFVEEVRLNRIISKIYDDINELINAVNQDETTLKKADTEGKTGDIRIVKDSTNNYYLEAKTDEGWIQSNSSVSSGFIFRERD